LIVFRINERTCFQSIILGLLVFAGYLFVGVVRNLAIFIFLKNKKYEFYQSLPEILNRQAARDYEDFIWHLIIESTIFFLKSSQKYMKIILWVGNH